MISSSAPNTITLQSVTERAQNLYSCLTDKGFKYQDATQEANELYQEGVHLVSAEVNKRPLFNEIASSVICVLNDSVSLDRTQHLIPFHRALSKAYRIFLELTWYRCWCQGFLPTLDETREKIIENCTRILSVLPPEEIDARFEYRCAQQAAKLLTSPKSVWKSYRKHFLSLGEAVEGSAVFGTLRSLQDISKDVQKDWIQEWYIYVRELRWLATNIKVKTDFEDIIAPRLANFQRIGKKYTVCLATVFIEIIKNKNPQVTDLVRKLAAKSLADLFLLKDHDRVSTLTEFALEKLPRSKRLQKTVKNEDRYWKTRALIVRNLEELSKDPTHRQYIPLIKENLIKFKNQSIHIEEKSRIRESLKKLEEDDKAFEPSLLEGQPIDDSQTLEAKLAIENKREALNLAEKALEELQLEEDEYENRLNTIWVSCTE